MLFYRNNKTQEDLISELKQEGVLIPGTYLYEVFQKIDRADFVSEEFKSSAYMNHPLSIGKGQTISQPYTVLFMLNLLAVESGNKILEIGYGSGWQTVLLSFLTGENGLVFATEIVPELKRFGDMNIEKYNRKNINTRFAVRGKLGLPENSPYDRIISGASATKIPEELIIQLNNNGILVTPVLNSIWKISKDIKGNIDKKEYPGFAFVPLIT